MGRSCTLLVDRARLSRPGITYNKGVVSGSTTVDSGGIVSSNPSRTGGAIKKEEDFHEKSDWIQARLRPVSGVEDGQEAMTKLNFSHELVLHTTDLSGNDVCPIESDEIEIRVDRNNHLSESISKFKITGAINEIRKRTKVQSYVLQVTLETEY